MSRLITGCALLVLSVTSFAQSVSVNTDGSAGPALFNVGNTTTPPFRVLSTGQVLGWNGGTASTPAYSFVNTVNTGMYLPTANSLGFSVLGTQRVNISNAGVITINQLAGSGSTQPVFVNNAGDLVLNAAITKTDPIYVRGTGLNNSSSRVVKIGHNTIPVGNARGLNFVVVDKTTHAIVSNTSYDTFGDVAASNNLATALNGLTNGQIGILTSFDAWEGQITTNLQNAFLRLGLYKAYRTTVGGSRRPYAAIFEGASSSSINSSQAVEIEYSADATQPYAELRGWLIDGGYVGTSNVPSGLSTPIGAPALTVNESAQIFIPNLSGGGNRNVFVDNNGMLRANSRNMAYVVDRAERTYSNANVGYVTASSSTNALAVEAGDVVLITVSLKFAFTGGSGGDDVRFRLNITGCTNTTDTETYENENFDNDRNEYQNLSMQFIHVVSCTGNLQFNLQMDHNTDADDGAKTGDVVITAVKYL